MIEEITSMMTTHSEVSLLLSFLDGDKSWDNILTIATTNYPHKLPANFVDRPSRFDRLYSVDNPSEKVREIYLTKLMGKAVHPSIIKKTESYSLAYLKELIVESKIYGHTISETLKDFEQRKALIKHGFEKQGNIGFQTGQEIQEDQERRTIGFDADGCDGCEEDDDYPDGDDD
jgi:SpoVK/Ycf46/Vps4 family AAA+-type ATPase